MSYRILSNRIYRDDRDISYKQQITEIYSMRLNYVNVIYSAYQQIIVVMFSDRFSIRARLNEHYGIAVSKFNCCTYIDRLHF